MAGGSYDGDGYGGHQNGGLDHMGDVGAQGEGSAVFVSNLQWWTTDAELEALCASFGTVAGIRFLDDKACGKSRGMAIVEFAEAHAAEACIGGLGGRDINGRPCRVSHQQARNQPGASSSGQYGGGRGAGGGGGRGRGAIGGRGGRGGRGGGEDMGSDAMAGGMVGAGGMMAPGGMMMMPGMPGMMGMGMPGVNMEMMQSMMMMPGMAMPFGMPGMPGFKPPPPPGGPPKKE